MALLMMNMIQTILMEEKAVNMAQMTPMDQEEAVNLIPMIQTTEKEATMVLVDLDLDMEMRSMIQTTLMEEREVSMV